MEKYVFGITGPTGAGKSTVSDIFRQFGVYVADADVIAKKITQKNEDCLDELREKFGESIFTCDGELDRKILAGIVFGDSKKLKLLNEVTHKYIKSRLLSDISNADSDLVAIDGAVIIGSPVQDMCNALVVVLADPEIRIERIMERDSISYDMAQKRVNAQMTNAEYENYADFVIKNNDINVRLEECVENIYNKIKNISKTTCSQT